MKKWIIIFVICGAIALLFTPVSGGFVNNISASQAIASPTVARRGFREHHHQIFNPK